MFYKECSICGASLEPGEKSDCTEKKEACTGGAVQTSNANNVIKLYDNSSIVEEICQAGGDFS